MEMKIEIDAEAEMEMEIEIEIDTEGEAEAETAVMAKASATEADIEATDLSDTAADKAARTTLMSFFQPINIDATIKSLLSRLGHTGEGNKIKTYQSVILKPTSNTHRDSLLPTGSRLLTMRWVLDD